MDIINGVDIVKISRIEKAYKKWGKKFLSRIYTDYEKEYIFKKADIFQSMAGIYSAKEAVAKALGTGIGSINFIDIEITHDSFGKPHVNISQEFKNEMSIRDLSLSISHDGDYVVAFVIGRRDLIE